MHFLGGAENVKAFKGNFDLKFRISLCLYFLQKPTKEEYEAFRKIDPNRVT
jgi:hypothetical protein